MKNKQELHIPVLLKEVLAVLKPKSGESYLDLTAGYGGHAREIISRTSSPTKAVLVDRDINALDTLGDLTVAGAEILHMDYFAATNELIAKGKQFDMILVDCGVSSPHLDNASRGFSFQADGPLDMRMDHRQDLTADKLINTLPEDKLADVIFEYGEERASRRIAKAICANRPLHSTLQLAEVIAGVLPRQGKMHPATRTFQAIRLAVNDELGLLERTLPNLLKLLKPNGRVAIISFHSLEDRIVKSYLQSQSVGQWDSQIKLVSKKPIVASTKEIVSNPRSRSAKLRGAVKIKK